MRNFEKLIDSNKFDQLVISFLILYYIIIISFYVCFCIHEIKAGLFKTQQINANLLPHLGTGEVFGHVGGGVCAPHVVASIVSFKGRKKNTNLKYIVYENTFIFVKS